MPFNSAGNSLSIELCGVWIGQLGEKRQPIPAEYCVWIGWSRFGIRCKVSREKGKHSINWNYFHTCNIEVIWLIDCTKANHNKSSAITKAYAAYSQGCITSACVRHCSRLIFLSLRQCNVFSTSQLEWHFDKTTCCHVRCKIWRRSDVLGCILVCRLTLDTQCPMG